MYQKGMTTLTRECKALAMRIYTAKLCGFYANPHTASPLEEPSFAQCIADAASALDTLASLTHPETATLGAQVSRIELDSSWDRAG